MSNPDPYNNPNEGTPAEKQYYGTEKDEKSRSAYEIYNEGKNLLREQGYYIEPSQDGQYALHNIRIKEHPGNVEGLNIPSNFWMWRNIAYKNPSHEAELLGREIKSWEDEQLVKFFNPLTHPTTSKTKPIFGVAETMIRQNAEEEIGSPRPYKDLISLSGGNGGVAFIPKHDWFREDVKQLTAGDLVTFLPESELNMFLNILGRVVVGRSNSETVEGTLIEHTFRSFAILVGLKGGIGKSTLMGHINTALKFLGYTVADMPSFDRPFGWATVVRSHLGYIDDLVPQSQKRFIGNELTKQIVSNALCTTEKKGIDPITSLSKTVLIANSNSFNPKDLMGLDDGVLSRLNLLQCHDYSNIGEEALVSEATKESPDYRTREHWKWISDQYNIHPIALGCWLLRLAADRFLENCGYEYNETRVKYYKTGEDKLETSMRRNRLFFKIGNIQNASEHLMVLNRFFLQCVQDHNYFSDLKIDDPNTFNSRLMFAITCFSLNRVLGRGLVNETYEDILGDMETHFYQVADHPEYHPYRAFEIIDAGGCVETAINEAKKGLNAGQTYPDALKVLFNNLRTVEGFRLIGEPVWLKRFWDFSYTVRKENEEIKEGLKEVYSQKKQCAFGKMQEMSLWERLLEEIMSNFKSYNLF